MGAVTESLFPGFGHRVDVVLQAERTECGLACLAMVAGFHGLKHDLSALRGRLSPSMRGVTLSQLMQMASELQLTSRALRAEPHSLKGVVLPCVIHWDLDHFVVLERMTSTGFVVVDPAAGRQRLDQAEFGRHFTGIVLELTPSPDFKPDVKRSTLTLGAFFKGVKGLVPALVKLLVFSVVLQCFTLLMPFYGQLVLDEAVSSADRDLLSLLVISFVILTFLNAVISALRTVFVLMIGSRLQLSWASRLLHHLLRLPLSYFETRHLADTMSRFKSLTSVQGLVTGTMVEAVIDGMMTITTLTVMFLYSAKLVMISVVALLIYAFVRVALYRPQRDAANEAIAHAARESGHFMESLRAMLSIKSFAREQIRESLWQNLAAKAIRAQLRSTGFSTAEQLANQVLFATEHVLVIWLGATFIMDGDFSIGMLVAFLAYKSQFTSRASALIDKAMDFRMVSIHMDRLSDIALSERETDANGGVHLLPDLTGNLTLENVSFRYSVSDPYVLRDLNLSVAAGECLAIVAPSGTGKTTLLKIMMSLLKPETGRVTADGRSVFDGCATNYRRQIASVMQDDTLLSGTLADNIAFFDPKCEMDRVRHCAKLAAIDEDIEKMPMGYYSLVGDMGATLSGGQKQRVLLARALYANPAILFLDEATSHLDPPTERRIHDSLSRLNVTRVIIAHRQETLSIADRVVRLGGGSGKEIEKEEFANA